MNAIHARSQLRYWPTRGVRNLDSSPYAPQEKGAALTFHAVASITMDRRESMKTGSPSVPSSRRRLIRARKVTIHRFAEWQNRPATMPPRSLARLLKMLPRH